jgi:hypothetical protein
MIIFGTRGLTLNKGSGNFHCPSCNTQRAYQHKKVQRFFTLYFIPLIPLDVVSEYIQCQTCKGNYKTVVLTQSPAAKQAAMREQVNENYRALLVHFARMSDRRDREFVDHVAQLYCAFNGGTLTGDEVAAQLGRSPLNIIPATERLAPVLSERGRENLVNNLLDVMAPLDDQKRPALDEVVKTLGMSDAHYRGILAGAPATPALGAPA